MENIQKYVEEKLPLLSLEGVDTPRKAETRAADLLFVIGDLMNAKLNTLQRLSKSKSQHTITLQSVMDSIEAKTITEKKSKAESTMAVTTTREEMEKAENELSYIRGCTDMFNNSHVLFRQISRGEV